MREVLPGVFHWTTPHPQIGVEVSSYWLERDGVLVDPLVPRADGVEWFAARTTPPRAVLLSNRHHYRDSGEFVRRFDCTVYCNSAGLHEFDSKHDVTGFEIGALLPAGAVAVEVGAICPDDTALHLPWARAVVLADAVVRGAPHGQDGPLGFVPDSLMDDPPDTRRRLLAACERLLAQLDFDSLLLAHGGPVIGDARAQLQQLLDSGGSTAFEL